VIGHLKTDGHLGRCHLKGRERVTAVGHNLRLVLAWLRMLLRLILIALMRLLAAPCSNGLLNGRLSRRKPLGPHSS
jgi:hypothetical protein